MYPPVPSHTAQGGPVAALVASLPVSEVFGPVWQGEGPHAGRVCHFVRLGMCNLSCSWCDTPFTWDATRFDVKAESPEHTGPQLAALLPSGRNPGLVILSGGEPLIHQGNPALQYALDVAPWEVHAETNGTIAPNAWALARIVHFTVSPKVVFQGDPEKKRLKDAPLRAFAALARNGRAAFKVVVADAEEVDAAARFFDAWDIPTHARWVMPEGVTADAVLTHARDIADAALEHGLNLTLRQHTLMYGTERAR